MIHGAIPAGAAVLELGCGVGRVSQCLAALGHEITGVDDSPEMLVYAARRPMDVALADITSLDLSPRRWPVVVMASRLINGAAGPEFLAAAARHLERRGCVLIERHEPGWVNDVQASVTERDRVTVEIRDIDRPAPGTVRATTVCVVGGRRYEQRFTAHDVDDARLADMAAAVGLQVESVLNDDRTWVRLVAQSGRDQTVSAR